MANYTHSYSYTKLGNINTFNGAVYTYHTTRKHAVTAISYDGNMTGRTDSTGSYTQAFNVENELTTVTKGGNVTTFAYDAAGIRVKTVEPDGVITDYPFPGYEVENPGLSGQTVRLTLTLAGQAVAVRVVTNSSNNLYYLYNDHLGSTTAVADSGGNLVAGSRAYYAPFGAYRGTAPTQTVTDRGFTGHLHNNTGANGIGLIYMRARFYVPGIGRFASADTIVPDAARPQSFNRYSYTRNNPLRFVDPSGHADCDLDTGVCTPNTAGNVTPADFSTLVTFEAVAGQSWSRAEMNTVRAAAWRTAYALADAYNRAQAQKMNVVGEEVQAVSAKDLFLQVHGGPVTFNKTGQTCAAATGVATNACQARTINSTTIEVYTNFGGDLTDDNHNVIHELGHAFESAVGGSRPSTELGRAQANGRVVDRPPNPGANENFGFGGPRRDWTWQQSSSGNANEEFADMYLGWSYNTWETRPSGAFTAAGQGRSDFMTTNMASWITSAITP